MSTAVSCFSQLMSEAEYLNAERLASERHEYVQGQVYLMAGASKRHNRIAGNIYRALMDTTSDCVAYISDMKVHSEKYHCYYYPDVVLGCAADETDDYILHQPCLVVEVTSDSTLRKDYLEKSLAYQAITSLQCYLIVAQDKVQVDMLVRDTESVWELRQFYDLEAELNLPCPPMTLLVGAIYQGVDLTL